MVWLSSRENKQLPFLVFVRIKFDENDVYSKIWFANEDMAFYIEEETVETVLIGIGTSYSVKYEIAGEISDFDFTQPDSSNAVIDFLERCETLKGQM